MAQGPGLGLRDGRFILLATLLASGVAFLMGTAVVVALPTVQSYFIADVAGIQWVISAQLIALTSFLLVGGAIGDRYGRKRSLIAGIMVFAGSSGLSAAAQSIGQLIAFQALQGVG
ncbi:MAG: MFS transporter, partial [Chloroflexota bacterium]